MTKRQIITSLLIAIFFCSCKNVDDCIYLIPSNYEGNLIVVFNQPNGYDKNYEDKKRLYRFNKTGVLMTKFDPNYGQHQINFFYEDSLGKRTPLKYILPSQLKNTAEVVAVNLETGNDEDPIKKNKRHFEVFSIARQNKLDSILDLRSKFTWDILK
jgi:hypothetical protein